MKQYERIQNRKNKKEDEVDIAWFSNIATLDNKIFVNSLNLHEIRNKTIRDYTGDF